METQAIVQREYKTPIYTRNSTKAYINRLKERDLESFNNRNQEYMKKSIEKKKSEGTYDQFKEDKKEYMRQYRLKKKQEKLTNLNISNDVFLPIISNPPFNN